MRRRSSQRTQHHLIFLERRIQQGWYIVFIIIDVISLDVISLCLVVNYRLGVTWRFWETLTVVSTYFQKTGTEKDEEMGVIKSIFGHLQNLLVILELVSLPLS